MQKPETVLLFEARRHLASCGFGYFRTGVWKNVACSVASILFGVFLNGVYLSTHSASAAGLPVTVEAKVDVVELVKEVASWVRAAVARGDESERQRLENSVPHLVILLTNLAGQKIAFSDEIENHLAENWLLGIDHDTTNILKDRLRVMNKTLKEIQDALIDIDPQWGSQHVKESVLLFSAVNRKGAALKWHTNYWNAHDMATSFRAEAEKLRETAAEIANTLKRMPG